MIPERRGADQRGRRHQATRDDDGRAVQHGHNLCRCDGDIFVGAMSQQDPESDRRPTDEPAADLDHQTMSAAARP